MDKILVKTEFLEKTLPVVLVQLGGYIDQSNADKIQKVFNNLFSSSHFHVIFDFTQIVYMSSAGWGIFVGEVKRFRENDGDIKIANMNAEIYEVFQMLEFFHILEDYNSVDEALESFGIEVKKEPPPAVEPPSPIPEKKPVPKTEPLEVKPSFFEQGSRLFSEDRPAVSEKIEKKVVKPKPNPFQIVKAGDNHRDQKQSELHLDITQLPIQEKIRKLVAQFPLLTLRQMKKMLRHEDFGSEKVGLFKLHRLLKELNLENKAKRYRYYRSC